MALCKICGSFLRDVDLYICISCKHKDLSELSQEKRDEYRIQFARVKAAEEAAEIAVKKEEEKIKAERKSEEKVIKKRSDKEEEEKCRIVKKQFEESKKTKPKLVMCKQCGTVQVHPIVYVELEEQSYSNDEKLIYRYEDYYKNTDIIFTPSTKTDGEFNKPVKFIQNESCIACNSSDIALIMYLSDIKNPWVWKTNDHVHIKTKPERPYRAAQSNYNDNYNDDWGDDD